MVKKIKKLKASEPEGSVQVVPWFQNMATESLYIALLDRTG
jgi:hypothetical protein